MFQAPTGSDSIWGKSNLDFVVLLSLVVSIAICVGARGNFLADVYLVQCMLLPW